MPIRAGSGGLKYPLPSRAQIQAQQNAAAASAGGSASATAYASNQRYAGLKRQLWQEAMQADLQRGFTAEQADIERGFRAEQQANLFEQQTGLQTAGDKAAAELQKKRLAQQAGLQQEAEDFQAGQTEIQHKYLTTRDEAQFEQDKARFEIQRDAGIEDNIRKGALELPQGAQEELRKLEDGKLHLKDKTPEQQAEFLKQYDAEKRRLLRTAQRSKAPTATEGFNQGTTFVDPQGVGFDQPGPGRIPGRVNPKTGEWKPVFEQPDQSKMDAEIRKIMGEKDGEDNLRFGKYEAARDEFIRRGKLPGPGAPKPPTEQPAQPPPSRPVSNLPIDMPLEVLPEPTGETGAPPADRTPIELPSDKDVSKMTPEEVRENQKRTEDYFAAKWETLPLGGSLVGPDGKTWIKTK